MPVWVLRRELDAEDDKVSVWASPDAAYQQAAADIQDHVDLYWDMALMEYAEEAFEINELVRQSLYADVIFFMNNSDVNMDSTDPAFWSVSQRDVSVFPVAPTIFLPSRYTAKALANPLLNPNQSGGGIPPVLASPTQVPEYIATVSGATCRGPCGTHNEFAYANKPDGTYVCYGCRTNP